MLDELKTAWKTYDKKIERSRLLSDRLIVSMIREKSQSRLTRVKKNYLMGVGYMLFWFVLGIIVIFSNPFDFKRTTEYLPVVVYCVCVLVLGGAMLKTAFQLQNVKIADSTLQEALASITEILKKYNRPGKFLGLTLKILLSTAVLFPLSFLQRKIENEGLTKGILETLLAMSISGIMIIIAHKAGAFREKNSSKFDDYQRELQELRTLSEELNED